MKAYYRVLLGALIILGAVVFFRLLIGGSTVTLFMPKGTVANAQRNLIIEEVLLMLTVAIPMFALLFFAAWKYREGNKNAKYEPEWHGVKSQLILWAIPIALIAVLATINWQSAHALDPYKPIPSSKPPLTINVVALTWKWLFIYPEQNIATVNFVEFPEQTPVHFNLTADAPMSSFWIPQLGSQIYAMAAMVTQLNLIASTTGEFAGKDTEINGVGYAGMTFTAKSVSDADFGTWVAQVKQSSPTLTLAGYNQLVEPSTYNPPAYYSSVEDGLYNNVVMKFMMPTSSLAIPGGAVSSVLQLIPELQNTPYLQYVQ
jgi:cytochrome o ubiquinol oxidase subunit II